MIWNVPFHLPSCIPTKTASCLRNTSVRWAALVGSSLHHLLLMGRRLDSVTLLNNLPFASSLTSFFLESCSLDLTLHIHTSFPHVAMLRPQVPAPFTPFFFFCRMLETACWKEDTKNRKLNSQWMLCREFPRKENASLLTLIKGSWGNQLDISMKCHLNVSILVQTTGDNSIQIHASSTAAPEPRLRTELISFRLLPW